MPEGIPYSFKKTHTNASVRERYEDALQAGESSGQKVSVAGRAILIRRQGGVVFSTMADMTGELQLFFRKGLTENFGELSELSLGDWVGAEGEVVKTRRGELSVLVDRFVVLARARSGMWDKFHGLEDVEYRYRHREADLWANPEVRENFLKRSRIVSFIRRFLEQRGFVEVETPILQPVPGGALAKPFVTFHRALSEERYLRVAPELYLKRLIVGGFERVFEIGRAFRNEGISPRHNPEFTILELYQAYADYEELMPLLEELLRSLALEVNGSTVVKGGMGEIDLGATFEKRRLVDLVSEAVGRRVSVLDERESLAALCKEHGLEAEDKWGSGKLVLELYEKLVEPRLKGPIFVLDYPQEVSPLARSHRIYKGEVERFELVIDGREIANAFSELNDPDEQRERFLEQARLRAEGDEEAMAYDEDYIKALELGLPPTAGLGVGIDRLVMLLLSLPSIKEAILFPTLKAKEST